MSISGTKATAKVTSGTGSRKQTDTLALEKVGAAWRISSLSAERRLRRAAQTGAYSLICVRRKWLPDGSRKPESMP